MNSFAKQGRSAGGHSSAIPRSVWWLGIVSLLMDIATEMIRSLLPIFLVSVLKASTATVGLIEGLGEATAAMVKLPSGWLSDRLGKRKALAVAGYSLSALAKPLVAFAPTAAWVLLSRVSDRVGKGIRDAPRDALMADVVPAQHRGAAFGLRQSLDTIGALVGPLVALGLMELLDRRFSVVFLLATIPAALSVLALVFGVRDADALRSVGAAAFPLRWQQLGQLEKRIWALIVFGAILTLSRFSEAFLLLRARDLGLPIALVPLVLIVMSSVYAASAYPMGIWSDRIDRRTLLVAGFSVLMVSDLVLAYAPGFLTALLGAGLWGLHMGMTQGLLSALVADAAPAPLRGSLFGLFNFFTGIAMLLASVLAGILWEKFGPVITFLCGATFAALGLSGMVVMPRLKRE
jgi:MFS family permease